MTPESVDHGIEELRNVDVSRHDATGNGTEQTEERATSGSRVSGSQRATKQPSAEVEDLERENFDLKATNRAKDQVIRVLREARGQLLAELTDRAHRIRQLEERLRISCSARTRTIRRNRGGTQGEQIDSDS